MRLFFGPFWNGVPWVNKFMFGCELKKYNTHPPQKFVNFIGLGRFESFQTGLA